jgi:hypothetical protein
MQNKPKFVILNPTHVDKRKISKDTPWSNDSFNNLSRLFDAQLFHINNEGIDETGDIYWLINFDINLLDKELDFLKKMKDKGKKIIVGFSQDRRFMLGKELITKNGTLFTEMYKIADIVSGGINPKLKMFGRYQDKIVSFGEILEDINFSIPVENREYDFMISGEKNGDTLSLETELALMIKEKHPDKKVLICIPDEVELKWKLADKYKEIEFPTSKIPFLEYLKHSKYYCNMEIRPRSGRCLIESYYCRVPFISSWNCYHSNLMDEFSYRNYDLVDIFKRYEEIIFIEYNDLIEMMEYRAKFDGFQYVYERIMEKLYK